MESGIQACHRGLSTCCTRPRQLPRRARPLTHKCCTTCLRSTEGQCFLQKCFARRSRESGTKMTRLNSVRKVECLTGNRIPSWKSVISPLLCLGKEAIIWFLRLFIIYHLSTYNLSSLLQNNLVFIIIIFKWILKQEILLRKFSHILYLYLAAVLLIRQYKYHVSQLYEWKWNLRLLGDLQCQKGQES